MFVPATGKNAKQASASGFKDTDWATYSVVHAWATQGIWPGVDFTDVNSCDRSHNG